MAELDHTKANGFPFGRPEGRPKLVADDVVLAAIAALPMETRLYPEIYAWRIVDALNGGPVNDAYDSPSVALTLTFRDAFTLPVEEVE